MPPRGYVLVFFCWALLTVITPTLIFWSAALAKQNANFAGEPTAEPKFSRRMMGPYAESGELIKNITMIAKQNLTTSPAPASESAPAPAPALVTLNQTVLFNQTEFDK